MIRGACISYTHSTTSLSLSLPHALVRTARVRAPAAATPSTTTTHTHTHLTHLASQRALPVLARFCCFFLCVVNFKPRAKNSQPHVPSPPTCARKHTAHTHQTRAASTHGSDRAALGQSYQSSLAATAGRCEPFGERVSEVAKCRIGSSKTHSQDTQKPQSAR